MEDYTTQKFKEELLLFLQERGIEVEEEDNYDAEDNYAGSNYYFRGKGVFLSIADLV